MRCGQAFNDIVKSASKTLLESQGGWHAHFVAILSYNLMKDLPSS